MYLQDFIVNNFDLLNQENKGYFLELMGDMNKSVDVIDLKISDLVK